MEELNNQLWEFIKSQQKTFSGDQRHSPKNNRSFDSFAYKNVSSWEELQFIIRYHFNRSLHYRPPQYNNFNQDCHPFGNMFEVIYSYYLPSMIFVGLVGNLLSCVVFLNTHLKMRSSSYYLAALACADFGFLVSLLLVWLNGTLEIPIFNIQGYCQCIVYVSSVCSFLSVWLIAAFTVERFIAVQYPLHRPHMCTVARAKAIVLYLVCISLAVHTYVFVTSGIIKLEDGSEVCEMLEGHRDAMRVINIVDSVLTLVLPLLLIVVMNSMIVYNLVKFSRKFQSSGLEEANGQNLDIMMTDAKSPSHTCARKAVFHVASTSSRSNNSFRRFSQQKNSGRSDAPNDDNFHSSGKGIKANPERKLVSTRSQQTITKTLLLISSAFVLFNLPSYGIRLYVFIFFSIWAEPPPVLLWCLQQMFMILYYTNFSINFLLYSMCGITFRRCLCQLMRKKLKKMSRYQCGRST